MRRRTRGSYFNRGQLARGAVVLATAAALCAAGVSLGRGQEAKVGTEPSGTATDPLATEFRRCNGLAYAALEDDGCAVAWAEHRRRFFMDRSRADAPPLPSGGER